MYVCMYVFNTYLVSAPLRGFSGALRAETPEPMGQGGQLPPLPFLAGGKGGKGAFPKI